MHAKSPTASEIAELLGLEWLNIEGGLFRQMWRSDTDLAGGRAAGTAIYALYTDEADSFSAMHRLDADEVWHFYVGDPLEMLMLHPDGSHEIVTLGHDLRAGQRPQHVVPRGTWMGASVVPGGRYCLIGCTMAPGFESRSYEGGERRALQAAHPDVAGRIAALTRAGRELGHVPEA